MKRPILLLVLLLPGLVLTQVNDFDNLGQEKMEGNSIEEFNYEQNDTPPPETTLATQQTPTESNPTREIPTPLPVGQSRSDHDRASELVLNGTFATKSDIERLERTISGLRKEIKKHPTDRELQQKLEKNQAELNDRLAESFAAQNAGNGEEGNDKPSADGADQTNPTAGVNGAEENTVEIYQFLFWVAVIIAVGITIGWWWGHGVHRWGLKDENRKVSEAFNPHTALGCGSFKITTTRNSSTLEARSEGDLQAEADLANARAIEARERSAQRRAGLAAASHPAPVCCNGAGVPTEYTNPGDFTHGSAEVRLSIPELERLGVVKPKPQPAKEKKAESKKSD